MNTLSPIINSPAWLTATKNQHALNFAAATIDKENWKYVNTKALLEHNKTVVTDIAKNITTTIAPIQITFVDGVFCPELSNLKELPKTVELCSISQAILKHEAMCEQKFALTIPNYLQPFASANFANFNAGYFLYIPANIILLEPIHMVFIATAALDQHICYLHNIILAEPNSQVTIIEEYRSNNAANYYNNIFTQTIAEENATISHFKLQQESINATHLYNWHITQEKNSTVQTRYANTGAQFARDAILVQLAKQYATYSARGIYLLAQTQTADYHTRIEHRAPNTSSNVLFKGVLNDNATGVFNGRVFVDKTAPKTETHLTNKNLILAPTANMYTAPELEIYAEDVICTHGATVGQLDAEALFYLLTRGIAESDAKQLLIQGFIQDILSEFLENKMELNI